MRKNIDLSAYLKSVNPIFSTFSCQFVATECVYSMIHGKNKAPSFQERYLVVASPGVFLLRSNNILPGINIEKIFPFIAITKIEVNPDCIIISQSKANNGLDDSQLIFKTVNQVIIAYIIHTVRESLFGDTALPYEIKIDPSLINDFTRQKYTYHSSSKIIDIFLSCTLVYDQSKLQNKKLDIVFSILNQIQEYGTLDVNSALMIKPYLASIAATLSIDNDIKEVRICDVNLGSNQILKFLISVLQRTKSIKRLIFIHVTFEDSDFTQFVHFMQSNLIFCGDEWIFDSCDFSKQTKFDLFFSSFKNYQRSVRILAFNRCHFSLTVFDKVVRDILFSNCFHSLEVLWFTNIEYPDVVLSFLIQLISSDLLIKVKKLNSLSIIDCCINLSDLFEKMVKLNSTTITNSNIDDNGMGIITANFSGNSFWSPVTDRLWQTLNSNTYLIFRKCTFSDESLASLFHALSLHKGKSLHLDCSGIAVSENGWKIFRNEIMGDNTDYNDDDDDDIESHQIIQKVEIKPICLGTLTELVWDNNVIDSNNAKAFTIFLKEQHNLRKLSLNDCINVKSVLKRRKTFSGNISSSTAESDVSLIRKSSFHIPRSSELEMTSDDSTVFEKEVEFVISCFVDFAKSSKLNSFRIRSNFKSTCIGPKLVPLLEQLLKSQRLRVLDILGQNIGDDNLEKVTNLIPKSLEEFIFDGNSCSADKLLNLLDNICKTTQTNALIVNNDQNALNLKKVNFPIFDYNKCMENLPSDKKTEFQTNFKALKRDYSKLFQPSDYIYDQNLNVNKSKNNLIDEFNNVELNNALSKIQQYQSFSTKTDVDLVNDEDELFMSNNDNLNEKLLKRKKISSIAVSLGNSNELQPLLDTDKNNNKNYFSMNNVETESILKECGLFGPKKDPMNTVMAKFSTEFSLNSLTQKSEMINS